MKRVIFLILILAQQAVMTSATAQEKPKLVRGETFIETPAVSEGLNVNNIFQSGMVLQRGKPIAVWGLATPGEQVSVSFNGQEGRATAAKDRSWKVSLPAMKASSKGKSMSIKGKDKTITLDDILIGDVWVLGGQSNMEFPLERIDHGDLEIASANYPNIRHITIPQLDGPNLRKAFPRQYQWNSWFKKHCKQGYWEVCTPETVRELSGLGYAFIRRIHKASNIPIGVIDTSRGGTTVETWTPRAVLDKIDTPEVKELLKEWDGKVAAYDPQKDLKEQIKRHEDWVAKMKKAGKPANRPAPNKPRPGPPMDQNRPGNCYASILAPLSGLSVKGAIFHQGYNNCFQGTKGAKMYYQIFGKMITAWRKTFNDPKMPFGIIALCTSNLPQDDKNFLASMIDIGPWIREAQYKTFLDFKKGGDKNIGFASSFDKRRSWYHPGIKIPVSERIARWALATQYGKKVKWEPPTYKETKVVDGTIQLKMSAWTNPWKNGPIKGFAIAGKDGKFQPAKADFLIKSRDRYNRPQYDRTIIVLSNRMVPNPVHFRYAWARNPEGNVKTSDHTEIPFATQRSDTWTLEDQYEAYTGKKPSEPTTLNRGERGELLRALKAADLERQLFEARKLIEKQKKDGE